MELDKFSYQVLFSLYNDYDNTFNELYRLNTFNEGEIEKVYKDIKTQLIETNYFSPSDIIKIISSISIYNNRYIKSYWILFKKIYEKYHPKRIKNISPLFDYFVYKEYGIIFDETNKIACKEYEIKNYSLEVHELNTSYRAIMDDDLKLLISIAEQEEFDKDQKLLSDFYPKFQGDSYLELCCYHGSVDCFKFLRTKFHSQITEKCLWYSFLSGNQEIMSECLKFQRPNFVCMVFAVISHNIDFVSFLMNEYNLRIDLTSCGTYNNLQSFLVYLDQTKDINSCFVYSPLFRIPSVCEYLLSHGASVNAKDEMWKTALQVAAMNDLKNIAEFLISHGANVNEQNSNGWTSLIIASNNNCIETAETLLLHGADVNAKEYRGGSSLHWTSWTNSKEAVELLLMHGADIDARDHHGKSPLDYAIENNSKVVADFLIAHGASVTK
ncbi:hypothetical protein TVAG_197410 [Trichomonas vaginalis G3]|uniref:DUF3447 domain-containing protein n=1 Tax=Trichomonas vaginalis (strain ATCC PRA-98 / G3) TaxID=412133 RepID=A2EPL1_TRIV3|nr:protein kinase protein [Trichomonas vaginalis G3]EAY05440.1 hypothetical protein TVAG_197410 [Trichomonas vaginalis G3]KAI5523882.1 protein kinase protein [Trichomonas vaginalis G3]|eukprot:XP_001317663.1 hypothetical protein [Trichomonas vaginalis G3]